jgi:hypothetical protein
MHEIYMLAVTFNRKRDSASTRARTPSQRARDEQAFYDEYGRASEQAPALRRYAAVPLVFIVSATLVGIAHFVVH